MRAQIRRKDEKIIVTLKGIISRLEAAEICQRIEASAAKTEAAELIFANAGDLSYEPANHSVWETLLSCLRNERVKAVYFISENENEPLHRFVQDYARRAKVPCFQQDSLEPLLLS